MTSEYRIVQGSIDEVESKVEKLICADWEPCGGLAVLKPEEHVIGIGSGYTSPPVVAQAMRRRAS